jgi:alkanesulfonate monooxygenase SsuD/methylene tetrahydromethanopterin reductase-like flavin-dependent oxidoreductase (luciferase family)
MFFELQLPRPWDEGAELRLFQQSLECAEVGEEVGVSYAWAQEHHFLEEYSHSTAPEVFLSAVSQRTKKMRVGHGVSLMPPAINHPARVAERIATLDLVSSGRVEWGTGESSSRLELEGFQINYIEKRAMWAEGAREAAKMLASEPYPGYNGKYFSMPSRNIVPKPVQRPHPPMWVACTNRDTMRLAARFGLGALTFAFIDADEAAFWVKEYYDTFKAECTPLGQRVNPNIAMLAGVYVEEDGDAARRAGIQGQQFFKWALAWYYRFGVHFPGKTQLWKGFEAASVDPMAGISAVGTPDEARKHFEGLERAGVDQVIMLQQCGRYRHEDICASLRLLGRDVLPAFRERHVARSRAKREELAPYIAAAMSRVSPIDTVEATAVESYPVLWGQEGVSPEAVGPKRAVDAAPLWRLHVGGSSDSG